MKTYVLILSISAAISAAGCKITTANAVIHGSKVRIVDARLFMSSGAKFTYPTTNGPMTLDVSSSPAAEAIKAAAEGAAAGVMKGMTP
jgi:hypothetical protein